MPTARPGLIVHTGTGVELPGPPTDAFPRISIPNSVHLWQTPPFQTLVQPSTNMALPKELKMPPSPVPKTRAISWVPFVPALKVPA